jgi:hypothetical protein
MEQFRGEPAPPDMATFKNLAEYWTGAIACELCDTPDDVKARFAELFDLHVTIHPDSSKNGYHFDLTANIPLEMEGEKPGAYDMVFSPSGRTTWQSPIVDKQFEARIHPTCTRTAPVLVPQVQASTSERIHPERTHFSVRLQCETSV